MAGSPTADRVRRSLCVAPLMTSGLAVVGAGMVLMTPPGAPLLLSAATAPVSQPNGVALAADSGGIIGQFIGFFIGNGTQANPNAGLLVGNGYSYSTLDADYCTTACSGS